MTLPPAIELTAPFVRESVRHIALAQGARLTGNETGQELESLVADNYRQLAHTVGIPSIASKGITKEQFLSPKVVDDIFLNQNAMNKFPSGTGITREEAVWLLTEVYDHYQ